MDSDGRVKVYDKWDVLTNELHGLRRQRKGYDKRGVLTIRNHWATWTQRVEQKLQYKWDVLCIDSDALTIEQHDSDDWAKLFDKVVHACNIWTTVGKFIKTFVNSFRQT